MSPEQARGKPVDKRSDIWSFGAVLFEMLSGQRPFEGRDVSETLGGVLRLDPNWDALPEDTPPHLRALLERCLQKEPKQRLHDVADVRLMMDGAFETAVWPPSDVGAAAALQVWQRPMPLVVAGLALLALGGFTVWSLIPVPTPQVARFVLTAPPSEPVNLRDPVAISPDGQRVVYTTGAPSQLYVRELDQLVGTRLAGTEGARVPFFSPDGTWIGFKDAGAGATGPMKKVPVLGGPPVTIADGITTSWGSASWGDDDRIIFTAGGGLLRVPASGGEPERLTTAEASENHRATDILPGSKAVLFAVATPVPTGGFESRIELLNLETGEQVPLIQGGRLPQYVATGHIVYDTRGTLRAVPFDLARLRVTGDPVPVVEGVGTRGINRVYSISDNGSLVYVPAAVAAEPRLGWVTRDGRMTAVIEEGEGLRMPSLSPDDARLAFNWGGGLWVRDLERGLDTRLSGGSFPAWTPDGAAVTFMDDRAGSNDLYAEPADGSGAAELLVQSANPDVAGVLVSGWAEPRVLGNTSRDGSGHLDCFRWR